MLSSSRRWPVPGAPQRRVLTALEGAPTYACLVTSWVWFVIAALSALAGSLLLAVDRRYRDAHQRERQRWAALRGWRFVTSDPVLADRWRHGVIAHGGAGLARNLVIGSLFTPLGRRSVRVFDHEQGGHVSGVVVAIQRQARASELVMELWLPEGPLPQDAGLTTLGPVGERIALVSDPQEAGPLVTPEFVRALSALGADIPVAWLERDWVLAAAAPAATPTRLERLLRTLDEIAELLDLAHQEKLSGSGQRG